jgi:2-dehydropantoate 2-reductase
VKSTDTESGAAAIKPHLAPDALVLSLQNGVENADRLRALLPQEVIAAAVYVGVEMAGPGHVRHHGRGELVIERSKASDDVPRTLIAAGVPTEISDNVRGELWAKLITNCAYNALSAITQLPYGRLVKGKGVTRVLRDLVDECVTIAKADGVTLPGDVDAAVRKIAETAAGQYSSTAQDLARGKRSEIDHLNGFIVRRGEALGVATPANRLLHAIVRLIETRSGFIAPARKRRLKLESNHETVERALRGRFCSGADIRFQAPAHRWAAGPRVRCRVRSAALPSRSGGGAPLDFR